METLPPTPLIDWRLILLDVRSQIKASECAGLADHFDKHLGGTWQLSADPEGGIVLAALNPVLAEAGLAMYRARITISMEKLYGKACEIRVERLKHGSE